MNRDSNLIFEIYQKLNEFINLDSADLDVWVMIDGGLLRDGWGKGYLDIFEVLGTSEFLDAEPDSDWDGRAKRRPPLRAVITNNIIKFPNIPNTLAEENRRLLEDINNSDLTLVRDPLAPPDLIWMLQNPSNLKSAKADGFKITDLSILNASRENELIEYYRKYIMDHAEYGEDDDNYQNAVQATNIAEILEALEFFFNG